MHRSFGTGLMTIDELVRAARILSPHPPDAWTPAVEGMLSMLTDLAKSSRSRELAEAYCFFSESRPGVEAMLMHCLPFIVLGFHPVFVGLTGSGEIDALDDERPYWTAELQCAVKDPAAFAKYLDDLARQLEHGSSN